MLLVNPKATTTNAADPGRADPRARRRRRPDRRGDRATAATRPSSPATAHAKGYDVVAVLGGDGTINETVNGLLNAVSGGTRPAATTRAPGGRR